ncbi:MAG: hypothetical protein ACK4VK_00665 [Aquificaceae bacterium]
MRNSNLDRVEKIGVVRLKTAEELGLTGFVGRACGIKYDVRYSFPYESYKVIKKVFI